MSLLHLTVPAYENEILGSLCSRTAATNGIESAHLFAKDMAFSFVRFRGGMEPDLTRFADLTGILHDTLSTMPRVHDGALKWRGHVLRKQDVVNTVRFCPECIQEAASGRHPEFKQYQRAEWAIRAVACCEVHGRRLVSIARKVESHRRFDLCAALREWPDLWMSRCVPADRRKDVLGEKIIARLYGQHPSPEWVDTLSLNAVLWMSEAIGTTLRHGSGARYHLLNDEESEAAREEGFLLLSEGRTAVVEHVERLISVFPSRKQNREAALFGQLYQTARRTYYDPELDPLREILREVGNETLPFDRNRLIAMRAKPIETELNRDQFDTLSLGGAADFLDMPLAHLQALVKLGRIAPAACDGSSRRKTTFKQEHLRGLLKLLKEHAGHEVNKSTRVTLETAVHLAKCSPEQALRLLMERRLKTAQVIRSRPGYSAIRLRASELSALTNMPADGALPFEEVKHRLGISLKDAKALSVKGHLPTEMRETASFGQWQKVVPVSAFEKFCRKYVSLDELARLDKGPRSKGLVLRRLRAKGVEPVFPPGEISKRFFLRSAI